MILELGWDDVSPEHYASAASNLKFNMLKKDARKVVKIVGSATFRDQTVWAPFVMRYWDYLHYGSYTEHFRELEAPNAEAALTTAQEIIAGYNAKAGKFTGRIARERYALIEITQGSISHWRSWTPETRPLANSV